ncbi:cobyrinic acid a,c-diamide synthase [Thermanaeromonas sp. C210]|nr:cobyrinic acid a,c-diamide synthase [Thermanaeromonas sp. C210]
MLVALNTRVLIFEHGGFRVKLAISGKGGVGKTTLAAALTRFFACKGYRVFAVDADPDTSLGLVLGLPEECLGSLKPVVEMREVIAELTGGSGTFFSLNPDVDKLLQDYTLTYGNISFLKMGGVKQGGSTCYCRENAVLNALVNSLLLRENEIVVLDMSAGIEHLTRGTARGVDVMLVVVEPSVVSTRTARVVEKLALELGVPLVKFVANKVRDGRQEQFLREHFSAEELIGTLPFQEEILDLSLGREAEEPVVFQEAVARIGNYLLASKE